MKKLKIYISFLFFFLFLVADVKQSFSQQKKIDTLVKLVLHDKEDSNKVNHLNTLAHYYAIIGHLDSSLISANTALKLSLALKPPFIRGVALCYNSLGIIYSSQGNYPESLKNYFASIKLREKIKDRYGIAIALNNIGTVYDLEHNPNEAFKNYLASLKITKELSAEMPEKKEYKRILASNYNNIAESYFHMNNYKEALQNYSASRKLMEELNDKDGLALIDLNIGNIYMRQGDYELTSKFLSQSLHLYTEVEDNYGIASVLSSLSELDLKFALSGNRISKATNIKTAEDKLNKALQITLAIGAKDLNEEIYKGLTRLDSIRKNYKGAYEHHLLFIAYRDSLDNEESRKKTVQNQMTYEFEKKEALAKDKEEKRAAISAAESHKQRLFTWLIAAIAIAVAIIAIIVFQSLRVTRQQKNIIEQKNILITDSIEYASNIQHAILPSEEVIKRHIPESFILYLPKDIVSGDFYWFNTGGQETASRKHQQENSQLHTAGCILIAAVDCTGHGVAGAFMSVMAYNMLENIVKEKELAQPSLILDELNKTLVKTLHQESETASTNYGMDIALLSIDKNFKQVQYAGAHNSLLIVRAEKLIETKANKTTIGMAREKFTNHTIEIQKGDMLYLFTDGYADQKGGPENKKLFAADFKELFISLSKNNITEQKQILEKLFFDRKGDNEQLDDVLVIGIRV